MRRLLPAPRLVTNRVSFTPQTNASGAQIVEASIPAGVEATTTPSDYGLTDFGQQRVAIPYRLLDLTQLDEINSDVVSTSAVTGASVAHDPATSSVNMGVSGTSGSKAVWRTSYQRYSAGAAQHIMMTGWATLRPQVNQVIDIGYFDDSDGLFFRLKSSGVYAVRRTSTSGSPVDEERLTSMSISDVLYHTIYEIRFRYLGHGPARFYTNTNNVCVFMFEPEVGPFMRSARLPLSCEIYNTGTSVANSFFIQCASVESENGTHPPMRSFGDVISVTGLTTSQTALLAIRLSATFQSVANRGILHPLSITLGADSKRCVFQLHWKPTLNSPTTNWGAIPGAINSRAERRSSLTAGTAPSSFGTIVRSFYVPSGGGDTFDIIDLFDHSSRVLQLDPLTGASGILMISGYNASSATTDVTVGLSWGEEA